MAAPYRGELRRRFGVFQAEAGQAARGGDLEMLERRGVSADRPSPERLMSSTEGMARISHAGSARWGVRPARSGISSHSPTRLAAHWGLGRTRRNTFRAVRKMRSALAPFVDAGSVGDAAGGWQRAVRRDRGTSSDRGAHLRGSSSSNRCRGKWSRPTAWPGLRLPASAWLATAPRTWRSNVCSHHTGRWSFGERAVSGGATDAAGADCRCYRGSWRRTRPRRSARRPCSRGGRARASIRQTRACPSSSRLPGAFERCSQAQAMLWLGQSRDRRAVESSAEAVK